MRRARLLRCAAAQASDGVRKVKAALLDRTVLARSPGKALGEAPLPTLSSDVEAAGYIRNRFLGVAPRHEYEEYLSDRRALWKVVGILRHNGLAGEHVYDAVLHYFWCANQRGRHAAKAYALARADGVQPTVSTFESLMRSAAGQEGGIVMVLRILSEMRTEGLVPSSSLLGALVRALRGWGLKREAFEATVLLFTKSGLRIPYNELLLSCTSHDEALLVLGDMKASKTHPDRTTWLAFLSSCVWGGEVEKAEEVFDDMTKSGVTPTEGAYARLMETYKVAGDVDGVHRVWYRMLGDGIEPGLLSVQALMSAQALVGNEAECKAAYIDSNALLNSWNVQNQLMHCFAVNGSLDDADRLWEARPLGKVVSALVHRYRDCYTSARLQAEGGAWGVMCAIVASHPAATGPPWGPPTPTHPVLSTAGRMCLANHGFGVRAYHRTLLAARQAYNTGLRSGRRKRKVAGDVHSVFLDKLLFSAVAARLRTTRNSPALVEFAKVLHSEACGSPAAIFSLPMWFVATGGDIVKEAKRIRRMSKGSPDLLRGYGEGSSESTARKGVLAIEEEAKRLIPSPTWGDEEAPMACLSDVLDWALSVVPRQYPVDKCTEEDPLAVRIGRSLEQSWKEEHDGVSFADPHPDPPQ